MIEIEIAPKKPVIGIEFPGSSKKEMAVDIGAPHSGTGYEEYTGPTAVVSEAYGMQILQTEMKLVNENIMVLPIPCYRTSNPYGGVTVYIGGE